jgi:hypothetical protein
MMIITHRVERLLKPPWRLFDESTSLERIDINDRLAEEEDVKRTISRNDGSTPRQALNAMHKDDPLRPERMVDETASDWEVYKKIGIVHVFDWNAHMGNT